MYCSVVVILPVPMYPRLGTPPLRVSMYLNGVMREMKMGLGEWEGYFQRKEES